MSNVAIPPVRNAILCSTVCSHYLAAMWIGFITCLLAAGYATLVLWYRWAWQRLAVDSGPAATWQPVTKVTVLVPARNESANIGACLQALATQEYPKDLLQIVVIDDASEDDTVLKVMDWADRFPSIECISLDKTEATQSHKKRAIEKGIVIASGELIVCTDADCTMGTKWLSSLVHRYEQGNAQFIAAPVIYQTSPTLLSVFQTLDFMTLQGITGASVSQRFHTMCNGANIAYSKSAFHAVNGFAGIDALPTGDDMLLMHKIYQQFPDDVVWLKCKEAIVQTQACENWITFFNQRIRWASKAAWYDDRRMYYVLMLVYFFNLLFLVLLIGTFFSKANGLFLLIAIFIKTSAELYFLLPVASFFHKEKWLVWFPFLEPMHIAYTIAAGWLGRFGSYEWKGRRIQKPSALVNGDR